MHRSVYSRTLPPPLFLTPTTLSGGWYWFGVSRQGELEAPCDELDDREESSDEEEDPDSEEE